MCGIVGQIIRPRSRIRSGQLRRMQEAIRHRGPDGEGSFLSDRVVLAMRRLAIIDLSGGNQPLANEDRGVEIVGNGEIYNYLELQKELKRKGHRLKTKSDIETVVHLYEDLGIKCVKKLRGMFALALYDKRKQRVFLIRDRLGEKPLYWARVKEGIVFASEMKALLKAKGIDKRINWEAVDLYFHYYYVPEPVTMFKGVQKLAAGSILEIDLKSMEVKETKYWDPELIRPESEEDPTEKIREVFTKACELTLRSDVPVGIALSGGIDSGSILATIAPRYKERMKAFSVGYVNSPPSDERKMAKKLAKKFKVEFIDIELGAEGMIDHFPQLVFDGDDPIADIAGQGIYSVNKLAKENGIKVLLGGIGGDELFWGYPWTGEAVKQTMKNRAGGSSFLVQMMRNLKGRLQQPGSILNKLAAVDWSIKPDDQMLFYDQNPGFVAAEKFIRHLYSKDFKNSVPRSNSFMPMQLKLDQTKEMIAKKGLDLIRDVWLVSNCIALNDRLSMASSVELRSPFLDYRLVETALSSKKNVMSFNKPPKYWFKKAMKGILPEEVINRRKQGFTPPVGDWIREIIKKYVYLLNGGFLTEKEILNEKKVKILTKTWSAVPMYWYSVYQLILLEIWGREYVFGLTPEEIK